MNEMHFPREAESGEVYAKHQFLRELTARAQTASQENYRLSFSMESLIVPEKNSCWQQFSGDPYTLCVGYVGTLKTMIWFNIYGKVVLTSNICTMIHAPKYAQSSCSLLNRVF